MDYSNFYTLSIGHLPNAFWTISTLRFDDYRLFRGELELDSPIKFQHNIGKRIYDIVGSGYAAPNLFSSKITGLLIEHKITGWKTYPCEIYDWNNNKIEGYSIFSVKGRCSAIDYSKSEKVMLPPLSPKGKAIEGLRGLYFDLNSWDGSDIFTPEGSKLTFVNESVKKLLEDNRITNFVFNKITEYER